MIETKTCLLFLMMRHVFNSKFTLEHPWLHNVTGNMSYFCCKVRQENMSLHMFHFRKHLRLLVAKNLYVNPLLRLRSKAYNMLALF